MPTSFKVFIAFIALIGFAAYGNQAGWTFNPVWIVAILGFLVTFALFAYQAAQMTVLARITRNQAVMIEQLNNIMQKSHHIENKLDNKREQL